MSRSFSTGGSIPFYEHGAAAQFLALRGGQTLGRILVSDDSRYNEEHYSNVGCFGMFECADDPAMARALLDAAAGWLRGRGRTSIMGPIDYSTNYPCGLLVDGFDTPPRIMSNHNRPYYAALLESWGLEKAKDFYCWWFLDPRNMMQRWADRAERIAAAGEDRHSPLPPRRLRRRSRPLQGNLQRSRCSENWGFVSLSDAEFRYFAKRLTRLAPPDLVLLAEVDGRPAGFSITLPDMNEAIGPLNGRLTNFGLPINLLRFCGGRSASRPPA